MARSRAAARRGALGLLLACGVLWATGCARPFGVDVTIDRGSLDVPDRLHVGVTVLDASGGPVATEERMIDGQEFFAGGVTANHLLVIPGQAGDLVRVFAEALDVSDTSFGMAVVDVMREPGLVPVTLVLEGAASASCAPGGTELVVTTPVDERDAADTTSIPTTPAGAGLSLREALTLANNAPGIWAIRFDAAAFPAAAPAMINVGGGGLGELPSLVGGSTCIDATSAGVLISGASLPAGMANGIEILSSGNRIIGLTIESFPANGIRINGSGVTPAPQDNQIAGCVIRANLGDGIDVTQSGAFEIGPGNVIVENAVTGIRIRLSGTPGDRIFGNHIGLDALLQPNPNGTRGILVVDSTDVVIGGDDFADANWIGFNPYDGIELCGANTTRVVVSHNFIGGETALTSPFGNGNGGVALMAGAHDNVIGPANVIAFNLDEGVFLDGAATLRNQITANAITGNQLGAILLWPGANDDAPAPVVDSFAYPDVLGTAAGSPDGSIIEIFADPADQARCFLGSAMVTGGSWAAVLAAKVGAPCGGFLTASATDPAGNTSPLSTPLAF